MPIWSPFRSIRARAYQEGIDAGTHREALHRQEQIQFNRETEMAWHVGRPVIVLSSEWEDPVIGFGTRLARFNPTPVLEVHDYVSNELRLGGGVFLDFSIQRLDAILTLDPYQAWSLLDCKSKAHTPAAFLDYDKPKSGRRLPPAKIMEALAAHGFLKEWERFQGALNRKFVPSLPGASASQ